MVVGFPVLQLYSVSGLPELFHVVTGLSVPQFLVFGLLILPFNIEVPFSWLPVLPFDIEVLADVAVVQSLPSLFPTLTTVFALQDQQMPSISLQEVPRAFSK